VLKHLLSTIVVAAAVVIAVTNGSRAETRVALVIGNGAYQNAPRLPNPANDASDVAAALKRDGFDTILATDLNRDAMEGATIRFARAARNADVALFYYSGHALQFAGVNYLAPIDIQLKDEADLRRMIKLDDVVSDLEQAKNLRILVLDACRDNPLADQLKRSIGTTRSLPLQQGLAKIDSPEGMIVAYATQPGRTAEDGTGRNSPYTSAFLKNIEAREEIGTIFRRISADVYQSTNHGQLPELSLSLIGEFYLRGKIDVNVKPDATSPPLDTAKDDFEAAERVDTVGGWDAFLVQHPSGFFAALAKERRTKAIDRAGALAALPRAPAPVGPHAPAEPSQAPTDDTPSAAAPDHTAVQLECSRQADALGLIGEERKHFRTGCKARGGEVVYPKSVDPKYAVEDQAKARMHTCVDQYNANKTTGGNGDLKWIAQGGGYYGECNKRLKGA
jgi:Caspase domain